MSIHLHLLILSLLASLSSSTVAPPSGGSFVPHQLSPVNPALTLANIKRYLDDPKFDFVRFVRAQRDFPLSPTTIDLVLNDPSGIDLNKFGLKLLPEWVQEITLSQPSDAFVSYLTARGPLNGLTAIWQDTHGFTEQSQSVWCSEAGKLPDALKEIVSGSESVKFLSPQYDRRRLLHWIKVIIGDIIRYQAISRACQAISVDMSPLPDWVSIKAALTNMSSRMATARRIKAMVAAGINPKVENLNIQLTLLFRRIISQHSRFSNIKQFIEEKFLPLDVSAMGIVLDDFAKATKFRLPAAPGLRINLSDFDILQKDRLDAIVTDIGGIFVNYQQEREQLTKLTNLFHALTPDEASLKAFKEACSKLTTNPNPDLPKIIELILNSDARKILSPTFDLAQLHEWMKVFIGDLVRYQLVGHSCGHALEVSKWKTIADKLEDLERNFMENWYKDDQGLLNDVTNAFNSKTETNDSPKLNRTIMALLDEKYFWLTFRIYVYSYAKDLESVYNVLCRADGAMEETYPRLACIPRSDALILIRWKLIVELDIYQKQKVTSKSNSVSVQTWQTPEREHAAVPDTYGTASAISSLIQPSAELIDLVKKTGIGKDQTSSVVKISLMQASFAGVKADHHGVLSGAGSASVAAAKIGTETIKTASKAAKTFRTILKVVTNVGKYLGPIASAICSIISAFEDAGTGDVIKEVRKGFDEMHKRFDQLGQKIDVLRDEITDSIRANTEFYTLYTSYDQHVNKKLVLLRAAATKYNNLPNNTEAHEELKILCEHPSYRPQNLLTWMHDHLAGSRVVSFAKALIDWGLPSRADLHRLLISFAYDASELGLFITTKCLPAQGNTTSNALDVALSNAYDSAVAQWQLLEIRDALARIDNAQLYGWQQEMEKDVAEIIQDPSTPGTSDAISKTVLAQLSSKYYWNTFQVLVGLGDRIINQSAFNPDYMRLIKVETGTEKEKIKKWLVGIQWSLKEEGDTRQPIGDLYPKGHCSQLEKSSLLNEYSQNVPAGETLNGVIAFFDWISTGSTCTNWKTQVKNKETGDYFWYWWQPGAHTLCENMTSDSHWKEEPSPSPAHISDPETINKLAGYKDRCEIRKITEHEYRWAGNENTEDTYSTNIYDSKKPIRLFMNDQWLDSDGTYKFLLTKTRIFGVHHMVSTGRGY